MGRAHDPSLPPLKNLSSPVADILIPTFDEDSAILSGTIDAALLIQGRGEIYVLDDGKRDWLKALCAQKDVTYIRREIDSHAKAGNLNHALTFIKEPFALILDADMQPTPDILSTAMPHFEDQSVAIVQFPQEYSNKDSFQHWKKGDLWHDLSFGLITVNPCRNISKASYWTGSPSIIRVSALNAIGGVQTGSVTEDLSTTVALIAKGFWIKSLKEIRAFGLAPQDYESFCIQRQRWAKGFFQLWHFRSCPIFKSMSFDAKLECLSDFLYQIQMSFYLLSLQVIPILFVFYGSEMIFQTDGLFFLWIASFVLMNVCNHVLGGKLFRMIPFQTYMRLAMFPNIWGFFESLPFLSNEVFEVTPKIKSQKVKMRTYAYISLFALLWIGNGLSFYYLLNNFLGELNNLNLSFFLGWSAFNFVLLSFGFVHIFYPRLVQIKLADKALNILNARL